MPKAILETPLHNTPDHMIAATSSENRRKLLMEVMDWLQQHGLVDQPIRVSNMAPDKDANIEESTSQEADVVAWEKTLVIALALGLIGEEEVDDHLVEKWSHIIKIDPLDRDVDLTENVGIFGGDVVTLIGRKLDPTVDPERDWKELLKLNRQFNESDTPMERNQTIAADRKMIYDLYTRPEGFFVMYKLGIALLGNDTAGKTKGVTAAWDIVLKFKQLPKEMIDLAYQEGTAHSVGPRVDLATIAPTMMDKDFGVFVKDANVENDFWKPIDVEVMRSLVIGGLLPPHMCIDLLAKFGETKPKETGKIEPEKITMNISKVRSTFTG
jgi:hypothetical protein